MKKLVIEFEQKKLFGKKTRKGLDICMGNDDDYYINYSDRFVAVSGNKTGMDYYDFPKGDVVFVSEYTIEKTVWK